MPSRRQARTTWRGGWAAYPGAGVQVKAWLEERVRQLLPCDDFHVVFTLPHGLLLL